MRLCGIAVDSLKTYMLEIPKYLTDLDRLPEGSQYLPRYKTSACFKFK
jgi:hypothetical protein